MPRTSWGEERRQDIASGETVTSAGWGEAARIASIAARRKKARAKVCAPKMASMRTSHKVHKMRKTTAHAHTPHVKGMHHQGISTHASARHKGVLKC